jgi:hypothetical protein
MKYDRMRRDTYTKLLSGEACNHVMLSRWNRRVARRTYPNTYMSCYCTVCSGTPTITSSITVCVSVGGEQVTTSVVIVASLGIYAPHGSTNTPSIQKLISINSLLIEPSRKVRFGLSRSYPQPADLHCVCSLFYQQSMCICVSTRVTTFKRMVHNFKEIAQYGMVW